MKKNLIISMLIAASAFLLCSCTIAFTNTGTQAENKTEPVIAEGLPGFEAEGSTDLPGKFFLSFVYSRNLIMLDGRGNIVWSKHEEQPTEGALTGLWDFKKHDIDGKTFYSYHDNTGAYDDYGLQGFAPGERVIMDEDFNEINRITFEESEVVEKGHPLDGHDFLMISPDHYIMSGYIKETVTNIPDHDNASVVGSYLQEVKDGKVVWDFHSTDYPELYGYTVTDASETADDFANEETDVPDYVHFNSMRLDADGNLVCSFRHINSILCLDRSKNEDQILWRLSGAGDEFGLSEMQKTSGQHYATVDGSRITVFDNNNKNGATRISTYAIDPVEKKLKFFKTYMPGGKFSRACGDVQHIKNELYMIGWGMTVNDNNCMSVFDFSTGDELLTVKLENPKNCTYRCVYYE